MGRVVAQYLLDLDEYQVQVPPGFTEIRREEDDGFLSPIHGQSLYPKNFKDWLERMVENARQKIRDSQLFQENKMLIVKVARGSDIWNDANCIADKKYVLKRFAAQPSTTHHVERGVKFGAHLASTNRSELKVAQYAMASNGFKGEAPLEIREDDLDDMDEKRSRRGDTRGLPKLNDMEKNVRDITQKLSGVTLRFESATKYVERREELKQLWTDKSETFLAKRSDDKKNSVVSRLHGVDENAESSNQWERETGWDKQPRVIGKIAFGDLRKDAHKGDIIVELRERMPNTPIDNDWNYTQLKKQLQEHVMNEITTEHPTLKPSEVKDMAKSFKPKSNARFDPVELENPEE